VFDVIYRYDPTRSSGRHPPTDAAEAHRRLVDGNEAFAAMAAHTEDGCRVVPVDLEDLGIGNAGQALQQQPFAVVIGCSDARVPTELVFDRACNELFVVRVAGNILGQDELGSVDYAVGHFRDDLKLLVVLGHSQCGAVTAAVDAFLKPIDYLDLAGSHHIRSIVNTIFPAVRGAARTLAVAWGEDVVERPGYRAALIECSSVLNAAISASILRASFQQDAQPQRVVFGIYDLETRRVHVPLSPDESRPTATRLEDVPAGQDGFRDLAARIGASARIQRLLAGVF